MRMTDLILLRMTAVILSCVPTFFVYSIPSNNVVASIQTANKNNAHVEKQSLEVFQDPLEFYLGKKQEEALLTPEQVESKMIESIVLDGNTRTSEDIIENNIALKVGTPFEREQFELTLKKLKNLQVFSKVTIEIRENKQQKLNITIKFKEKWTMIPYIVAGSGGGSSYYALGLYDTNFIGRLYTFNFTYGCKNNNCSSVIFFRNPSLLGKKINYVINPALYHNIYTIYDRNREVVGSFSNRQDYLLSYADFEINPGFSLGAGIVYQKNVINTDGLTGSEVDNNHNKQFTMPDSTNSTAFEGRFTIGQINYDGIVIEGINFVSFLDSTLQMYTADQNNYSSANNTLLFYQPLPLLPDSYFAFRGNLSITSSTVLPQYYYLGGLDKIRGFYDGEFAGKFAWFTNAELRVPSFVGNYVALQHVLFSDSGFAASSFSGMFTSETAVSVGTGIRLIFPDINKIALRVDYAYTINPFQTYGFSFGLLQFF